MTRRPLPPPSRADAVRYAIADAQIEGQTLSPETLTLLRLSQQQFEAAERRRNVVNALAITAMEGGKPSPYVADLLRRYEAGEVTAAEMSRLTHEYVKRQHDD